MNLDLLLHEHRTLLLLLLLLREHCLLLHLHLVARNHLLLHLLLHILLLHLTCVRLLLLLLLPPAEVVGRRLRRRCSGCGAWRCEESVQLVRRERVSDLIQQLRSRLLSLGSSAWGGRLGPPK